MSCKLIVSLAWLSAQTVVANWVAVKSKNWISKNREMGQQAKEDTYFLEENK